MTKILYEMKNLGTVITPNSLKIDLVNKKEMKEKISGVFQKPKSTAVPEDEKEDVVMDF